MAPFDAEVNSYDDTAPVLEAKVDASENARYAHIAYRCDSIPLMPPAMPIPRLVGELCAIG